MLAWLVETSPFARMQDRHAEYSQVGSIRIVVGLLCIARLVPNLWASLYLFSPEAGGALPAVVIQGVWVLVLIAAVTVGFLTPITAPVLVLVMRAYERRTHAASLATDIASIVLTFLFVVSAGSAHSLDAWLMRRRGWLGSIVRGLYRIFGAPSLEGLAKLYLLFFVTYALMHLGGAIYHWRTEAWTSRDALAMVLSSSHLSRFWAPYRALELAWPRVAHMAATSATVAQLLMQTLTLPLLFWRRSAPVVIVWGYLFTTASMLMLQLNYLGAFEFLLWLALFRRPRQRSATAAVAPQRPAVVEKALNAFGAIAVILFLINDVAYTTGLVPWRDLRLTRAFWTIGLQTPNVFNDNDLRLGDAWPVIYYEDRQQLLPFHGMNGERLAWIQWSDLLFYGISNQWRNEFNEQALFDLSDDGVTRLQQVALVDHRRRHAKAGHYVVDYFRTRASHIREPPQQRFERVFLGSLRIACSGLGADARCSAVDATDARPR